MKPDSTSFIQSIANGNSPWSSFFLNLFFLFLFALLIYFYFHLIKKSKTNGNSIFENFQEDPELYIALAVIILFTVLKYLGVPFYKDTESAINVFAFIFFVLTTALVVGKFKSKKVEEDIQKDLQRTKEIINILYDSEPARIILYKNKDLWSNFEGVFYAYNPSYHEEWKGNFEVRKASFSERFKQHNFRAYYFFLLGDDGTQNNAAKEDFKFFKKIVLDIHNDYPNYKVNEKLRVFTFNDRVAKKEEEIYLGTKYGQKQAIIEFRESFIEEHNQPRNVLIVSDKKICEDLEYNLFREVLNSIKSDNTDGEEVNLFSKNVENE